MGRGFRATSTLPVAAATLRDWHLRPGAFERLNPPWRPVEVVDGGGKIGEGHRVTLRMPVGPLRLRWVARHEGFDDAGFRDVQERGPFRRWRHEHRFEDAEGGSRLEDRVEYELPLDGLTRPLFGGGLSRDLRRVFRYRHLATRFDLDRHAAFASAPRKRVAVSGASGLVGSALSAMLGGGGHEVLRLVRREARAADEIRWDPSSGAVDSARLERLDAVVHLAGESIAGSRWTDDVKRRLRDSRVRGTRLLVEALRSLDRPPPVLVAASATGYYGDRGDEPLDEHAGPGEGFLAEVCREWETEAERVREAGVRLVQPRIGIVLAARGGALAKMLTPFRLGAGGPIGSGRQWMGWIALNDLVGLIHAAILDERFDGTYNAVAPEACRQREFAKTLGRVLRRPTVLPAPAFALRMALGEMADALLLSSARVRSARLASAGFRFTLPDLESALRFELGRIDASRPGSFAFRTA